MKAHPDKIPWYSQFHEDHRPMIEVRYTPQGDTIQGIAVLLEGP